MISNVYAYSGRCVPGGRRCRVDEKVVDPPVLKMGSFQLQHDHKPPPPIYDEKMTKFLRIYPDPTGGTVIFVGHRQTDFDGK